MKPRVAGSFLMLLLTSNLFLAGCASTYDMKEGGEGFLGGGYLVEEQSSGVFRITAKTDVAQWSSYSTARQMWAQHAREACGSDSYTETDIYERDYERYPRYGWARYIVTVKTGIAVCQSADQVSSWSSLLTSLEKY